MSFLGVFFFFKVSDEKNKKAVSKPKPLMLGANEMFPLPFS